MIFEMSFICAEGSFNVQQSMFIIQTKKLRGWRLIQNHIGCEEKEIDTVKLVQMQEN